MKKYGISKRKIHSRPINASTRQNKLGGGRNQSVENYTTKRQKSRVWGGSKS